MEEEVVESPFQEISFEELPLHQFVFKDVHLFYNKIALVCGITGRCYTYKDVVRLVRAYCGHLQREGLQKGQVLAIVLPNLPEYPIAFLGALSAGLSVCPVSHMYKSEELTHQFKLSNCAAVISYNEKMPELKEVADKLNKPIKLISISELIFFHEPESFTFSNPVPCRMDDLAVIPFSSGTTSLPKAVCLTHRNIVSNLQQVAHQESIYATDQDPEEQQVVLAAVLFSHLYGIGMIMLLKLMQGAKLITMPKYEKNLFLNLIVEHEVTMLYATPVLLQTLSSDMVKGRDLISIKQIACSGASMSGNEIEKILAKKKNITLFQNYGMTEGACMMISPSKHISILSIGWPTCNSKAKIIDIDTGEILGPGRKGELCFKGPQIMNGYLNNPEETAKTIDDEGWLHTGDLAYYDDDKYFYIVGRLKEIIKVKGFQVAPAELEEVLCKHPQIEDAGVVGIPHYKIGEIPVAFLVAKSLTNPPSFSELTSFLKERVAPYKLISHAFFIDSIPKNLNGKISRKELKNMLLKQDIFKNSMYSDHDFRKQILTS